MFASSSRKWPAMCVLESYVGLRLLLGVSFFLSQDVIAIGGMTYVPTRLVRSSRSVCVRVNTGIDNSVVKPIHLPAARLFPGVKGALLISSYARRMLMETHMFLGN